MNFLMAANWKMYKTAAEARTTLKELAALVPALPSNREAAIFAPAPFLYACKEALPKGFFLGAQNFYPEKEGAFTGEVSLPMLTECGCSMVLTGHSERRSIFGETDSLVGEKTAYAINNGFNAVLCVGETLEEREANKLEAVLERQLEKGLANVQNTKALCVAYEPVWAIGTGKVAGEAEIVEAHGVVRSFLNKKYNDAGASIRILYGGSVKPDNAKKIVSLDNVNGVLVGGASLQADSFSKIVTA